ncbi:MAG TPA: hypothetical protein VMU84_02840 [Thermoanaerobaculia bacterium]|nr:hypothetical protein [Thermoanaerobaculia bacterium]
MPEEIASRPTAPFTIFYRTATGEGGFTCSTCGMHRHDVFARASDVFAVCTQHLNLCRGALRHRPIEGTAILDGAPHGVVLREGFMILALDSVFASAPRPARVVA